MEVMQDFIKKLQGAITLTLWGVKFSSCAKTLNLNGICLPLKFHVDIC